MRMDLLRARLSRVLTDGTGLVGSQFVAPSTANRE